MPDDLHIPCDLPCEGCGYNLRTLDVDALCPECGHPVTQTLTAHPYHPGSRLADLLDALRRRPYTAIAQQAGCEVDAILFILDAFEFARALHGRLSLSADRAKQHITARDLCDAVAGHARRYFNDPDEARELLAEWGIRRSEDVGRIIFTMVDAGRLAAQEGESASDFDGLFTLDTLFAPPD
jgi:uncharacterized repeat protein (TIGR04138 family)